MEKIMVTQKAEIILYGTTWCGDTRRARKFFDDHKISYQWVDIDGDKSAEEYVISVNKGCRSVPTILFPDGSLLVEPSTMQLLTKFELAE
jgi:mycoredoxin